MLTEPAQESRALAVNPRTLDILEPTGITAHMLRMGMRIYGLHIHRRGKVVATLSLAGIHPRYPFMLALSQATSEQLLAEALNAAGGRVERGVKMVACRNIADGVEVTLERAVGGREVARCPWMLAADGAHSVARQQLGIDFVGSTFASEWHLVDGPLRTALAADHAHIFFGDGGAFLFLFRVIDDLEHHQPREPVWRVMGNRPDPLSYLEQGEPTGPPVWTSRFHISHKIDATLAAGAVYFAGDAAHVHSPLGARGMNLGLEDAWVFAELVRANRLDEYNRLRRPVDRRVVQRVAFVSRVVAAESRFYRFLQLLMPAGIMLPFLRPQMADLITGLDHELPEIRMEPGSMAAALRGPQSAGLKRTRS
jgi:2-polyprenyl-6-methoxyphenol hydroxylase-like FAD-dependent oxidoreductase